MLAIAELFRSLKVFTVVMVIGCTVYVMAWERGLGRQVDNGLVLPAPTRQEMNELRARQGLLPLESRPAHARTRHVSLPMD